jgi:HEPN domain-containing protein/predicted nucleotidyltransferase
MVTFYDAKEVAADIVQGFHPLLVTLFGSVARDNVGNDLDLLIVVDDTDYLGIETDTQLQRSLGKYYRKFDIEPFVIPVSRYLQQIREGAPFLNAVLKDGRVLYMNNHVSEWLRQAGEEHNTAKYLADGGFHRSACYHAEQAIEKFLKARLIGKGWDLEKTHSIRRLLAISEDFGLKYDLEENDVVFVDSIYRGRYPAEAGLLPQGEPEAEDAERAVNLSKSLLKQVIAL